MVHPIDGMFPSSMGLWLADAPLGFPIHSVSGALIPSGTVVCLGSEGSLPPFPIFFGSFLRQPDWESPGIRFEVPLPVANGVRSPCLLADSACL